MKKEIPTIWTSGGEGVPLVTKAMQERAEEEHLCLCCGREMGPEWLLGAVCGKCVRANHRKATGRR